VVNGRQCDVDNQYQERNDEAPEEATISSALPFVGTVIDVVVVIEVVAAEDATQTAETAMFLTNIVGVTRQRIQEA